MPLEKRKEVMVSRRFEWSGAGTDRTWRLEKDRKDFIENNER